MGLNRLNVGATPAATGKKKADKPRIAVKGNSVQRYVEAVDALKTAEATKKQEQVVVFEAGVALLMKENLLNSSNPISSVEVTDETGAVAQVQFKDQYGVVDADVVSGVFDALQLDVNEFVTEELEAKFDSTVFLVNGEFNGKRYETFMNKIAEAAKELNVPNPMTIKKKVTAKQNFHTLRWRSIVRLDAQQAIQRVLPATVAGRKVKDADPKPAVVPAVPVTPPVASK